MIESAGYRCVTCRAPMTSDEYGLLCTVCARTYPMLGRVPVLLEDPFGHASRTLASLDRLIAERRGRVEHLEKLLARGTARDEALALLLSAMIENARFLLNRRAELVGIVRQPSPPPTSSIPNQDLGYLADVFDYIRQDWSTLDDCRADVETIVATLRGQIRRHVPNRHRGVVLGAGLARFATELRAELESVIAIDVSLIMALTYQALCAGEVRVFEINERNAFDFAGMTRAVTATAVGSVPVAYCVADALRMPFADASVDVVVSAFFTDVVPLSRLLAEVRRVLAPGGAFIHFGSLGYHFYAPEEMWTAEEVRGLCARTRLELREELRVPVALQRSNARMSNTQIDAWSFVAVAT